MAGGNPELEFTGKSGTFGVVSGTAFTGKGASVTFVDETIVTVFTASKHSGATLVRTWPAGSFYDGPFTALTVTGGFALIKLADL